MRVHIEINPRRQHQENVRHVPPAVVCSNEGTIIESCVRKQQQAARGQNVDACCLLDKPVCVLSNDIDRGVIKHVTNNFTLSIASCCVSLRSSDSIRQRNE
jgi:hypothetical protein